MGLGTGDRGGEEKEDESRRGMIDGIHGWSSVTGVGSRFTMGVGYTRAAWARPPIPRRPPRRVSTTSTGGAFTQKNTFMNGCVDDTVYFGRVLSPEEVKALYDAMMQ